MKVSAFVEIIVGLFILLGMLALVFLSLKVSNLAFVDQSQGYILEARFNNIGGLTERSAVKASGVRIGRVRSINYDNQTSQAVVMLYIEDSNLQFPVDTSARILTAGLLGEQYISVEPGAAVLECNLEEDPDLIVGFDCGALGKETSKFDNTQGAVILENLIGQVLRNMSN